MRSWLRPRNGPTRWKTPKCRGDGAGRRKLISGNRLRANLTSLSQNELQEGCLISDFLAAAIVSLAAVTVVYLLSRAGMTRTQLMLAVAALAAISESRRGYPGFHQFPTALRAELYRPRLWLLRTRDPPRIPERWEPRQRIATVDVVMDPKSAEERDHRSARYLPVV
jgi:hypothetical protein